MTSPGATPRIYRFGLFEADLENAVLLRQGIRVHLQEQPARVLAVLLEHAGQTVSREELRRLLWPGGVNVEFEDGLNAALHRLRCVLSDDPERPTYIETVPKRGYRFIAPVAAPRAAPPATTGPAPARTASAVPPVPWWLAWTAGVLVLAIIATALAMRRKPAPVAPPRTVIPPPAADLLMGKPAAPEAARFYVLGVEKLQADDPLSARDLFLQAEGLAPDAAMVHLMLARAWGGLGYDAQAKAEVGRAYSLAAPLPAPERLLIQGGYYASVHDLERAAAAYRALYALNPGSIDDAEQLIAVLNAAGRRDEALGVLQQLRQLPPPASSDPRLDFWQARLVGARNNAAAAPYLKRALAEAAGSGRPLLYARFRLDQCLALVYSAHPQQADEACQDAYQAFLAAGNRLLAADAVRALGDRRGAEGNFDAAVASYERALAMLRPLGEHEKTGAVLNNMAVARENQGQLAAATGWFREAEADFQAAGDTGNVAVTVVNLGDIRVQAGDLRGAEAEYQRTLRLLEPIHPEAGSYAFDRIGAARLAAGDLAGARDYADKALEVAQASSSPTDTATATATEGDVALAQGRLSAAAADYQRALALVVPLNDRLTAAELRSDSAVVALESGRAAEAGKGLSQVVAVFRGANSWQDLIHSETELVRALRAQGEVEAAKRTAADALAQSRHSQDPALTLPLAIENARLEAAASAPNAPAQARLELQAARQRAQRLGYYPIACKARLALAELDLATAPASARAALTALAAETHARGLDLLAAQAAALTRPAAPK